MVRYGALTGCTNVFYSGGASRAAISGKLTLNLLRKISRNRLCRTTMPGGSHRSWRHRLDFATAPVETSYLVFGGSDLESDVHDIPGFIPVASYGSRKPINENEIPAPSRIFRFITSPELVAIQDAATSRSPRRMACSRLPAPTRMSIAWSWQRKTPGAQVALRGANALTRPTFRPARWTRTIRSDSAVYISAKFYMNATVLNNGWMAIAEVGASAL